GPRHVVPVAAATRGRGDGNALVVGESLAIHRGGRTSDARTGAWQSDAAGRIADSHDWRLRLYGARMLGNPPRHADADYAQPRAGGGNFLSRRELWMSVHPGQP